MIRAVQAAVLVGALCCVAASAEPERYVEKSGGFSIAPPAGWKAVSNPQMKYKLIVGPAPDTIAPTIGVVDGKFGGTLDEYAAHEEAGLQKMPGAKIKTLGRGAFKTAAGAAGVRLAIENTVQGKVLRQIFYFFDAPDKKFMITCTASGSGGDKLDATFDTAVKSFKIEPSAAK